MTRRVIVTADPFDADLASKEWGYRGKWPSNWVSVPGAQVPFVAAFRRRFAVEKPSTIRVHVTADERYELFVDGERAGRGPERGTRITGSTRATRWSSTRVST